MLRLTTANGTIEIEDRELTARLLENEQAQRLKHEAEAQLQSTVYRIDGAPDSGLPFGGLLTVRLQVSPKVARALLTEGRLPYFCVGTKKGYRVSERDVRAYEASHPKAA